MPKVFRNSRQTLNYKPCEIKKSGLNVCNTQWYKVNITIPKGRHGDKERLDHRCDKTPDKSPREERIFLTYTWGCGQWWLWSHGNRSRMGVWSVMAVKSWQHEQKAVGHTALIVREQRAGCWAHLTSPSHAVWSFNPQNRPSKCKVGISTFSKKILKLPHKHAQEFVSDAILHPVKWTISINHLGQCLPSYLRDTQWFDSWAYSRSFNNPDNIAMML